MNTPETNRLKCILILLLMTISIHLHAQGLSYSGPNSFNISSQTPPTHLNENLIPTIDRTPTGMAFGDSGNKMYLTGSQSDFVVQFSLSTAYDYNSKGPMERAFRVNSEETSPQDVDFNDDGTRMYILGESGDDITEYALSTAWDVSTSSFTDIFDVRAAIETLLGSTNGDRLTGMTFNDDGSKLFVADRRSDDVFEFELSTNYDVSTAGAVVNNIAITGENNVRDISFNNDGTELYIIGSQGDDINTFPLSTAYDLSSVGTSSVNSLPGSPDNTPQAILINNLGTTFYVAGSSDDEIKEYTLSSAFDFSSTITFVQSSISQTKEISPRGMSFNNDGSKLFVAGDAQNAVSEISLSIPYDISTGNLLTALYVNAEESNIQGLAFNNTGTSMYIIGNSGDEINGYDLSAAYDLTSTITTISGSPFDISAEDNNPTDIFFNDDGTKFYLLGNGGNDINQYSLSPAYDLNDANSTNLDIVFPLDNASGLVIDTAPQGMFFNPEGTKLYIAGNSGNDINEISLSNAFDLSSGTIALTANYSIASEETTITDVIFNPNGSKFFICGTNGDDMNQYQTKGNLVETSLNNGSIDNSNPFVVSITGDTFADSDGDNLLDLTTEFIIGNLPTGLTPIFTLSDGDTVATLTFSGTATNSDSSDDISNLSFTFTDAAFSSSNAADVALAVGHTNVLGIDFNFCIDQIVYESSTWTGGNNSGIPDNSVTDLAKGINVLDDVTISSDVNCDCLLVDSGVRLTVADGIKLEVTNLVQLDGEIRLNGDAQLLQTFSGIKDESGSGTLTIDQTSATTNIYQSGYWTSPVTTNGTTFTIGGAMKDGTTTTPQDISFTSTDNHDGDGTTTPITVSGRWLARLSDALSWTVPIDPATETFTPGEAYNMKGTGGIDGSSPQNYSFVGLPNAGDYSLTINDEHLYLIGNPYPSALDANQFITDNTDAIGGTMYFYESGSETSHFSSDYSGGYATYNGITGVPFNTGKTPAQYLPIAQGFFVSRDVGNSLGTGTLGSSAAISFNNAQRAFELEGTSSVFFSRNHTPQALFPVMKLGMEFDIGNGVNFHRQVAVGFVGATRSFENGLDSKMLGLKKTDLSLFVQDNSEPYVIIGIEYFSEDAIIPIRVDLDIDREVSFSLDQFNGMQNQQVHLVDYETGTFYDIHTGPKEIQINKGSYSDRFAVCFKRPNSLSDGNELVFDDVSVFHDANAKEFVIKTKDTSIDCIKIYNLLGQQVMAYENKKFLEKIRLSSEGISPAVYIIRLVSKKGVLTRKLIVN